MSRISVILCEGYQDRAFWYGLLEYLKCKFGTNTPIPENYAKGSGEYSGITSSGNFVSILPVGSGTRILPVLKSKLEKLPIRSVDLIVINIDSDYEAGSAVTGLQISDLLKYVQKIDTSVIVSDANILANNGKTQISLARWEVAGETPPGVPTKQTLERVVCMAIQSAYPERAEDIKNWLESRRNPPESSPKAFSWSYMAGWFPEAGCDHFFRALWSDPKIATELERVLRENGAWRIAELLAL